MKWICWIEGCLKSTSISVLVNGSPTNEFIPHRGLRQGDPLAPLLFSIVAEGLTGLMREALDKSLFSSLLVGKNNIPVNILQYALRFCGILICGNVVDVSSCYFSNWFNFGLGDCIKLSSAAF